MEKYTSNKISNLSWICSILIVFIHAGTYAANLPGQSTSIIYGMNASTFVQMFIGEGVCRIAVPLFFIFSGYLFFHNYEFTKKGVWGKYKKRFFSLVIPYLFWSIGTYLFFLVAQLIPATAPYFATRPVIGIGFWNTVKYLFIDSLNSPLWYLFNLIFLTIISPLIYLAVKYAWWLVLPCLGILAAFDLSFSTIRCTAICAFCVGSFIAIKGELVKKAYEKIEGIKKWLAVGFLVLWLGILIWKSIYLCSLPAYVLLDGSYTPLLRVLNKVNIVIGIPALWLGYDFLGTKITDRKFKMGQYGMMLFVMHHPIIAIIKKLFWVVFGGGMWASLIYYFASAIITIAIVLGMSILLKKLLPRFYSWISGGR